MRNENNTETISSSVKELSDLWLKRYACDEN